MTDEDALAELIIEGAGDNRELLRAGIAAALSAAKDGITKAIADEREAIIKELQWISSEIHSDKSWSDGIDEAITFVEARKGP